MKKKTDKTDKVEKYMVTLGKEREVIYHEFVDTEFSEEAEKMLVNYAMEHILSDRPALINYAFNRILIEQIKATEKTGKKKSKEDNLKQSSINPYDVVSNSKKLRETMRKSSKDSK